MTTETYPGPNEYTISGTGPYEIGHEYTASSIVATVTQSDGTEIELESADYTVTPASGENGDVTLASGIATTYAGDQLVLARRTTLEQGWQGQGGAREDGLEEQLDRLTMASQETRDFQDKLPLFPDPAPDRVPVGRSDGKGYKNGPTTDEISNTQTYATNASDSADAAATSATNAAASESNAASSASAASTSETNAASSESNAASSASAAASAESNAAATFDQFDDIYLGQKTSDPSTDNDGDPLQTGALYFNTTDTEMKVWTGSAWEAAYVSLSGALLATNNLSDLDSAPSARGNLGLGSAATQPTSHFLQSGSANQKVMLANRELVGDIENDPSGALAFDTSEGVWLKAANSLYPDHALLWSRSNFTAGDGIKISYSASGKPTLSVEEQPIGVGQTPQDMTASRAFDGTVYQNTTGRVIWVAANEGARNQNHLEISADNSTWISTGFGDGGARSSRYAIVPDGWYYRYGGTSDNNAFWTEVR